MTPRALVVFGNNTGLWWLRLLKPGFRHCFVALDTPAGWVVIDPLSHRTHITVIRHWRGPDLAQWYRMHGLTVVHAEIIIPIARCAPWRPFSCVEAVKRVLGINDGRILTPWQLFGFLSDQCKNIPCSAPAKGVYPSLSLPEFCPGPPLLHRSGIFLLTGTE
jgi:hypothetical protein